MTQGIVLLSLDGFYIDDNGNLPIRPAFDKEFITMLIKGKRVLCSKNTLKALPQSILDAAYFTTNVNLEYDINFGINTFTTSRPDQLLVVRSKYNLTNGSMFKLDSWSAVYKSKELEIYV